MTPKEFVNYQNKLYWVYKRLKSHQVKDGYMNDLKDHWNCDVVVRNKNQNDDSLLFLRVIEEAEIVKSVI
jgi:hypothetical protein